MDKKNLPYFRRHCPWMTQMPLRYTIAPYDDTTSIQQQTTVCCMLIFAQSNHIIFNAAALDLDITTAFTAHYHRSFYSSILYKSSLNSQLYPCCPRFCFFKFFRVLAHVHACARRSACVCVIVCTRVWLVQLVKPVIECVRPPPGNADSEIEGFIVWGTMDTYGHHTPSYIGLRNHTIVLLQWNVACLTTVTSRVTLIRIKIGANCNVPLLVSCCNTELESIWGRWRILVYQPIWHLQHSEETR